jgi:hypothetical protein
LKAASGSESSVVVSAEHVDARWIPVNSLAAISDLPEIYKVAILNWKRELELRSRERLSHAEVSASDAEVDDTST